MTLTQTADITRKIITLTIIVLFLATVSFIIYKIWHAYYISHLPPIEEKADSKFGLLPPPDFPQSSVSSSNFSYSLDTTTGSLPKLGVEAGFNKLMKVYFITRFYATLLSPERSKGLAEKFGITAEPQILSETQYRFSASGKSLIVNLDSGNFLYSKEATSSARENLDFDDKLVSDFENILTNLGILTDDLKKGRTKVTLLKNAGGNLIVTNLRTEASAAQISLWPQNIDQKSIFSPDFNKALVNATVYKSASDLENYLIIQFINFPIDTTTYATYPIKTAESAYNDLKGGKGVVILQPPKPQVSISSVYLGYFISDKYTLYLQPIYIFEGQNFVAYVPAISNEFFTPAK